MKPKCFEIDGDCNIFSIRNGAISPLIHYFKTSTAKHQTLLESSNVLRFFCGWKEPKEGEIVICD